MAAVTTSGATPQPDPPAGLTADVSEQRLRERGTLKWAVAGPGDLPAWVAETDVATFAPVLHAVQDAVGREALGYPPTDDLRLRRATAAFLGRRFGWEVDPDRVLACGDVMAGVALALRTLCEDAPVVVPTPAYPPFLDVVGLTGRAIVTVPCSVSGGRSVLDLDGVDAALAAGARTVLIANPHNPLGRAYSSQELAALRDVVLRHGSRVVSDDIHAPLVLPGARHVPYGSLPGAAEHTTTVVSASKAFNLPALKCAQVVAGSDADRAALRALPPVANHGVSLLGVVANQVAWEQGDAWLDAFVAHLALARDRFTEGLARVLPRARVAPLEATYLAWVDLREHAPHDPAALVRAASGLRLYEGRLFGPGGHGHVRVNLATSLERVDEIVARLGASLSTPGG